MGKIKDNAEGGIAARDCEQRGNMGAATKYRTAIERARKLVDDA